jgi:hypothetical protein
VSIEQANANVNLLYRQILLGFPDSPLSQENLAKLNHTRIDLTPWLPDYLTCAHVSRNR